MASQKETQFTSKTSILDTDFVRGVSPGLNFTILFSDFKTSLGVTGTLVQKGDPLAVPVLNQPGGGVNEIRNMESGAGIIFSASPEGGVLAKWNVAQDPTGVSLISGLANAQPAFSSFVPGSGMAITKVGDIITFTATGAVLPATKAITVNQLSDFPAAVAGSIPLEPDTTYIIANAVTTADGFILQSSSAVVSFTKEAPTLTYTGTGTMFTLVDATAAINALNFDCPNGKAFDCTDTTGNNHGINISNSRLISCVDFGSFDSMRFVAIFNSDCFSNSNTGPTFLGSGWGLISVNRLALTTESVTYTGVDLGNAASNAIELTDLLMAGPTGSVGIAGLSNSGNITAGNLGTISFCNFGGDMTPITNIDPVTDVRWTSIANDTIGDSRDDSLISIQGNTSVTTIATQGVPVLMAGTWIDVSSSRFVVTLSGGRMTFVGERNMRLPISKVVTMLMDSGGDKQASAYIAINGSVIAQTKQTTTASSSKAGNVNLIWQHNFVQNDFVELFLANESDEVDMIGQSAVARID